MNIPKIATANGLTRGQESAVLVLIAKQTGIEDIEKAVKAFLQNRFEITKVKILKRISRVQIKVTTNTFCPQKKFVKKSKEVSFFDIGECFTRRFLVNAKKTKNPFSGRELGRRELIQSCRDNVIIDEFGGEKKVETRLAYVFAFLKKYKGNRNNVFGSKPGGIFYVRDTSGELCAVAIRWRAVGWTIHAHALNEQQWSSQTRIFYSIDNCSALT